MSRKLNFDESNPRQVEPAADTDTTRKRRPQSRLEHEFSRDDVRPQTSAAPQETTGVALPPAGTPSLGGNETAAGLAGLQHGAASIMRNISPDETPDRNTAVSATRFSLEVGATALGKMTLNRKQKRKSKLKEKDSSLKHEPQEDNDTLKHDEAEQPDNADSSDERGNETDGGTPNENAETPENAAESSEQQAGDADDGTTTPAGSTSDKPDSKLKFAKDEKVVAKLEKRAEKLDEKLEKAQDKLPTRTVKKKTLEFDEDKGKTVSKLTHEVEKIPIGEAKWNKPKNTAMPVKAAGVVTSLAVTKIHAKIHQVEHDNVGVKVAHKAELMAESGYRGAKQSVRSAYRFHKNRPYRRVAKLEQKSIKNKMRLDYRKALRDNPKLKSNPLSRFMQKRAIKRNYAKQLRAAKQAGQATGKAVGFTAKAAKVVTAIIRKNPIFLVKAGLILLIIFLILSMFTMCVGMFSGTSSFVGHVMYPAEFEDIDDASIMYTELETDLRIYINEIEENYPDYDEYRLSIDSLGHDPFALIAFLSAVYEDFIFADVAATIQAIFDAQYTLELESVMEIREREEERTGTGSWTDEDGNSHSYTYTYTVIVEYEWHILYVTLTSRSFTEVLLERMDDDQTQHFYVLMQSLGARQIFGNPFDFDWRPFVSSLYGYRIHPIDGGKQFHWGLDMGLPTGTPLLAGLDGVVVYVGYHPTGYGNIVIIECEDGMQMRYAHCHEIFVTLGQEVERGDVIATVGTTGASTGPHLHIEVSVDGRRLNPIFFLEFR